MSNTTITLAADDKTAAPLVATIRAAVNGAPKFAAYVAAHGVTRENVAAHGTALAVLAYPNLPQVQKKDGKRTKFGNAVSAAKMGLVRSLDKAEPNQATVDYIAKVIAAVDSATTHDVDAAAVLRAVEQHVESLLS